jgi:sulfur-carrier protein
MPKVKLPTQLREAAGGETAVSVEGATVGAVLDALFERHGELRDRLSDGDGGLRRFVNVYVDGEDIRFGDGLETPGVSPRLTPPAATGRAEHCPVAPCGVSHDDPHAIRHPLRGLAPGGFPPPRRRGGRILQGGTVRDSEACPPAAPTITRRTAPSALARSWGRP